MEEIMDKYKLDWVKVQLTRNCNLKCTFCSQAEFRDCNVVDTDLFIKNVLDIAKPRLLILTGGEPLTKLNELYKLLAYCKEHNIETGIFSNATLVTEKIANELKNLGLDWFRTSINGYCQEIHELSYPKGTFNKTLQGIKFLKQAGIYVKARTTVTKNNQDYIEELVQLMYDIGIKELDFRPYLELGDCNPHMDNSLNTYELVKNCAKIIKLKSKYKDRVQLKLLPNWFDFIYGDVIKDFDKYNNEVCSCGRKYIYIDAIGNYRACAGHQLVLGNMKDSTVDKVWTGCPFLLETRNYKQDKYCENCPFKIQCHKSNCHLINYEKYSRFDKINPTCPIYQRDNENNAKGLEILRNEFLDYYEE